MQTPAMRARGRRQFKRIPRRPAGKRIKFPPGSIEAGNVQRAKKSAPCRHGAD
jgi:hypothetical protein